MGDIKSDVSTVFGQDVTFKGELSFDGSMHIDGRFDGKLNSKGKLSIGKGAQIAGEINIGAIKIEGNLKGNVVGQDRVELASTAQVLADIRAPKLIVSEGATFVGNVHVSPDALKAGGHLTSTETQTAPLPLKR